MACQHRIQLQQTSQSWTLGLPKPVRVGGTMCTKLYKQPSLVSFPGRGIPIVGLGFGIGVKIRQIKLTELKRKRMLLYTHVLTDRERKQCQKIYISIHHTRPGHRSDGIVNCQLEPCPNKHEGKIRFKMIEISAYHRHRNLILPTIFGRGGGNLFFLWGRS